MKQIIEIEVPEGKQAIYKDGKITFETVNHYETIKSVEDAIIWININLKKKYSNLIQDYYNINNEYFKKLISLKLIYIALTEDEVQDLTEGNYYYPLIRICNKKYNKNNYTIIGSILNNNKKYFILGGSADYGSHAGLCYFDSLLSVSFAAATVAMFGFQNERVAKYMSIQFGKLLFEAIYGFQNVNWKWV